MSSFPRGGTLQLAPTVASNDEPRGLFAVKTSSKSKTKLSTLKKKRKLATGAAEQPDEEEAELNALTRKPKYCYSLSMKGMSNDVVMLGIVTALNKTNATVSLPSGLTGNLSIDFLSDQHENDVEGVHKHIESYLKVGQMVKCVPVSYKRKLEVSMSASRVNRDEYLQGLKEGGVVYGTVHSVEDHGYVISMGNDSISSGFLEFSNKCEFIVGQAIDATIVSVAADSKSSKRVFKLRHDIELTDTTLAGQCLTFGSLQVGMLVESQIKDYIQDGAWVGFMGFFTGTVDLFNLTDWKKDPALSKKSNQQARVLFINFEEKEIGLSFATRIVHRTKSIQEMDEQIYAKKKFEVFDDCIVRRVDASKGVLLEIPLGDNNTFPGYARLGGIIRESGDEVVEVNQKFKVDQRTPCKVLSYAAIDGCWSVSLSQQVIDASVLQLADVEAGSKLNCKVFKIEDFGILVSLSANLRALIPNLHLGDVLISDPRRRFKVGQTLNCKVLQTSMDDSNRPRILLTNKKSLIGSDLPNITSYEQMVPGTLAHGFVTMSRADRGVMVTFFNNVHGIIRLDELKDLGIDDPSQVYQLGKVVKVKVVSCNPKTEQMQLTFRTAVLNESAANLASELAKCFPVGSIVEGKIKKKTKLEIIVALESGKTQYLATLPVFHLTDVGHTSIAYKNMQVGDSISGAIVVEIKDTRLVLSKKPALAEALALGLVPSSQEQITEQTVVVGFVKNVTAMGVFVGFLNGITGMVPRANVADEWVSDPTEHFKTGRTVYCSVVEVDASKNRLILSLKSSSLEISDELRPLFAKSIFLSKPHLDLVGKIVKGKICQVKQVGFSVKINGVESLGFCLTGHSEASFEPVEGDSVECRVLDFDASNKIFDVTMRPSLLHQSDSKKLAKKIKKKTSVKGVVELVKADYAVISLPEFESAIAIAPIRNFNGKIPGVPALAIDASVVVSPTLCPFFESVILVDFLQNSSAKEQRLRSRSRTASVDISGETVEVVVGAKVTARVRDINKQWMSITLLNAVSPAGMPFKCHAHVHLSAVADDEITGTMFQGFSVGSVVQGVVVSTEAKIGNKGTEYNNVMVSLKESDLKSSKKRKSISLEDLKYNKVYQGFVENVLEDGLMVSIAPNVRGMVYCAQVSNDPDELNAIFNEKKSLPSRLQISAGVSVKPVSIDLQKRHLQLTML